MNDWRCDIFYSSGDIAGVDGICFKLAYFKDQFGQIKSIGSINELPTEYNYWELL